MSRPIDCVILTMVDKKGPTLVIIFSIIMYVIGFWHQNFCLIASMEVMASLQKNVKRLGSNKSQ